MTVAAGQFVPTIDIALPGRERTLPHLLPDVVRAVEIYLRVPAGFIIDEMPRPVALEAPFGRFEASWERTPEGVIFRQRLGIARTLTPASDHARARSFFEQTAGAQNAAMGLIRKSAP